MTGSCNKLHKSKKQTVLHKEKSRYDSRDKSHLRHTETVN